MECLTSVSGGHNIEVLEFETFFRRTLTRKISKDVLEKIQLRYIPDYIRELRNKQDYWEEEYKHYQDKVSLGNWRSFQKQYTDEVRKHKTILKNLDVMRNVFVNSDDYNYFSESIDPERVQAMVDCLKENQTDHEIFYRLTAATPGQPKDVDNLFYVTYAIWALYGEFKVQPPGSTAVQVKEENSE